MSEELVSRRGLLVGLAALPLAAVLLRRRRVRAEERPLAPTPACGQGATPEQTEGPYWTPDSPRRDDFSADGAPGEPFSLGGAVVDTSCRPVPDTLLDFWQCDGHGVYDNEGYTLRGHQFSDADGAFRLTTVKPGLYPGRTRHFHVKVRPPGGDVLTTQLYFPDEPANRADGIYRPELEMTVSDGNRGSFTFVVEG